MSARGAAPEGGTSGRGKINGVAESLPVVSSQSEREKPFLPIMPPEPPRKRVAAARIAIALPPRPPVPEDQMRAAAVADIRLWVRTQSEAIQNWAIRIGGALVELRRLCHEDGKLWMSHFPRTEAERDDKSKLPFSYVTANKLIAIYNNAALRDLSHERTQLPSDWNSLYALSRIPAPKLAALIQQRTINPNMSRAAVTQLVRSEVPNQERKALAKREKKLMHSRVLHIVGLSILGSPEDFIETLIKMEMSLPPIASVHAGIKWLTEVARQLNERRA